MLLFSIDESFRKGTDKLNRVLLRKEGEAIQFRTVANTVEREGELIGEQRRKKAEEILERYGFDAEGKKIPRDKEYTARNEYSTLAEEFPSKIREDRGYAIDSPNAEEKEIPSDEGLGGGRKSSCITEDLIKKAIEEINAGKEKELQIDLSELHDTFEDPKCIKANISLDDVLKTKRVQEEKECSKQRKGRICEKYRGPSGKR